VSSRGERMRASGPLDCEVRHPLPRRSFVDEYQVVEAQHVHIVLALTSANEQLLSPTFSGVKAFLKEWLAGRP